MSPDTSFIPPDVTPPDPPEAKAVALAFSIFMFAVMLAFTGFVCVEFLAEMSGHPLQWGTLQSPQNASPPPEQDIHAESKSPFELITPQHQTQMQGPEIVVIYTQRISGATPPTLLIDDVPHPWETQYGTNTWFARLALKTGLHRVQAEESEAEFFVETLDSSLRSSELWTWHRPHPGTDNTDLCYGCHEMHNVPTAPFAAGHNKAIGLWKGIASCFECHNAEAHAIRHAALQPITNQCLRCHTMH